MPGSVAPGGSTVTGAVSNPVNVNNVHRIVTFRDPLTGKTRVIVSTDSGVYTAVDRGDGQILMNIGDVTNNSLAFNTSAGVITGLVSGDVPIVTFGRNGNLQTAQLYAGAVQPSSLAAQVAGALFYVQSVGTFAGNATTPLGPSLGSRQSASDVLSTGILSWTPALNLAVANSTQSQGGAVATDPSGSGAFYQYEFPANGGGTTNFFQINGVGQTNGLLSAGFANGNTFLAGQNIPFGSYAINPINSSQILISAPTAAGGAVYLTTNGGGIGRHWGPPVAPPIRPTRTPWPSAAPDPTVALPGTTNFLYAGTLNGRIFVSGNGGRTWTNVTGLDGSAVLRIIPSPVQGSHEAYALTVNGVYHIVNSNPNGNSTLPAALRTWQRVNGNSSRTEQSSVQRSQPRRRHPDHDPHVAGGRLAVSAPGLGPRPRPRRPSTRPSTRPPPAWSRRSRSISAAPAT